MQIVRISHLFYPDTLGDYLLELSIRQVETGHEVDVVTWNKNKRSTREMIRRGFIIHRLSGVNFQINNMISDYPYLPGLSHIIESLNPQIIHAESHLFLPTVTAVKEGKRLRVPSIVTVHGVMAQRGSFINLAQYSYLYTLGSWVVKNADKIICLTYSDAREISSYGCLNERIKIIPNAVDTNRFKPRNGSQENQVVWAGRFVPEKGLSYLIKAGEIVVKNSKNTKFMVIGEGPLKTNFIRRARNSGLPEDVFCFAGPYNRDRIAGILGAASVVVLPSLKEGLPLLLLEAMACGKAVIGSDIPGINDVITHQKNGFLVPPRRPEILASAILTLLNDRDLSKRLGQNARQLMVEKYSWSIITRRLNKLYCEVIEESK